MKNIALSRHNVSTWISQQNQPFFVFWHTYDVHLPYIVTDDVRRDPDYLTRIGRTGQRYRIDWQGQNTTGVPYDVQTLIVDEENFTRRRWDNTSLYHAWTADDMVAMRASYDNGIVYTDDQLRAFFEEFKKNPAYNNTVIIITAEHGDDLQEHGFFFHRDVYDVNVHVPLAIIVPGMAPRRVATGVSLLDIMPTVLHLANLSSTTEGDDLLEAVPERVLYSERVPFDQYAVRKGKWKFILRNGSKTQENISQFMQDIVKNDIAFGDELYDLSTDPGEQRNFVGMGLPIESELRGLAIAFRTRMRDARTANAAPGETGLQIFTYP